VAGIKVKTLRKYNPELRQSATPTDGPYLLKLPKDKKEQFLSRWNSIPQSERFAPQFIVHRVRYGESLWTISKKYGASIHDIAAVNKLRNRHKIKVGNKLKIPIRGGLQRTWGTKNNGGPSGHYKVIYKVKRGDSLGQIAEDYKTNASKVRRWNGLKYGSSLIYPGQKLKIWVKEG
jgi:membrane-bound lytic murein transglycosylase D